tara:strand:+ start:1299 stop:2357 length:1059 start_codon:yes stop_codon:yes gene_type:complete
MKPFFKWSGGKRKEIPLVEPLIPKNYDTFYEPFLGAGALWLHLEPKKSVVNDNYDEVINFYKVLQKDTDKFIEKINSLKASYVSEMKSVVRDKSVEESITKLNAELDLLDSPTLRKDLKSEISKLKKIKVDCEDQKEKIQDVVNCFSSWENELKERRKKIKNLKEELNKDIYPIADKYYYHYRDNNFTTDFDKAVRFYMLRQLSFSGMLRFDSDGNFNIPYGWYDSFKGIEQEAEKIKEVFGNTTFLYTDWEKSLASATKNDFVFLDPPYTTRTFSTYHPDGDFGKDEQIRLANWFKSKKSQALIIINKDEFTESLYKDYIINVYDYEYSVKYRDRIGKNELKIKHLLAKNY